jgi:hypothetical protein
MSALDVIQSSDRDQLVARWQEAFKCEPPSRLYIGLLRGVLAWHVQSKTSGNYSTATQTLTTSHEADSALRPGTRLLREWRGTTHEVLVVAHGFEYAGKTYKSLSAIARAITGTPWSGPAFFGTKR